MHRKIINDSEIDPMNAVTRTVFFDHTKSSEINSNNNFSKDKPKKPRYVNKTSQTLPKSLDKFMDSEISDEKLNLLEKEIDAETQSHIRVKQRLSLKSKSVKKAKVTLVQTQRKLEDVMKNSSQEFEQHKLELIGTISSKMAHDLKNPLNVLNAHIQLVKLKQEKREDEIWTNSLTKMEDAISNITDQINDVMDFIRKPNMNFVSCDLKKLLTKTVEDVQIPKDVELKLSVDSCIIKWDVLKVKGIITNILQNSIQEMKSKGEINLIAKDSENNVEINIIDSGQGIAEENIEKIFEPLFTTKSIGNGLGLASCKEFIEMHGGTISVKNNPTTFTIILPKINS